MLRVELNESLKKAIKSKENCTISTVRLILAALKDRDIAARSKGNPDGISDDLILQLLQTMVKQRRDSTALYKKGNRPELAAREMQEIEIIESFMPEQMAETEIKAAVVQMVKELNASSLKEMGSVMSALRERYAGRMDFSKASAMVKQSLA
tara:strand:+ start:400 stop:855 length:456 start_codon:yes stop_codon:yes gene_type:complete